MNVLQFPLDDAGSTMSVQCTNEPQNLPAEILTDPEGKHPSSLIITVEIAPIRFSFNADPELVRLGHVVLADTILIFENESSIQNFKFMNAGVRIPATLQITPFFK